MKKSTRILAMLLVLVMVLGCFAGCKQKDQQGATGDANATGGTQTSGGTNTPATPTDSYTYRDYASQLGTVWNPHAWKTNADKSIMQYLQTPFVQAVIKDSAGEESNSGVYQWAYKAATSITDVTAANKGDLTKYKVTLPAGQTADQVDKGYVFEIALNPNMKWQDGTPINADSYVYSMKALLDPAMKNYRASLFYSSESALAGAFTYANYLNKEVYQPVSYKNASGKIYMDTEAMGYAGYLDANSKAMPQYLSISDETIYNNTDLANLDAISGRKMYLSNKVKFEQGEAQLYLFKTNDNYSETYDFGATVGFYKVDDYTVRYVTQSQIELNYFLSFCTSNWLVHEGLYEAGKSTADALVTTNYGTDVANTMSYGPYKIESLQKDKQIVLVQNENHYEYTKKADGSLYAETSYEIDGEKYQCWQTTKIIIDQMSDEAAKEAFLKGDLSRWNPTADELSEYDFSDKLYREDQTYTQSLFFNSDEAALKKMDTKGNKNSVVLSNVNFRKAFSLAINREEWVTATAGYKPAYALMNDQYFYDIYGDPYSTYRGTKEAMDAMCKLYGIGYVDGTLYGTVEEAYASISGYYPEKAKTLMAQACNELVQANLYTKGEDIKIRVAYAAGELTASDEAQITKINEFLNAAAEGSGFGTITLEGVGNVANRYDKVGKGDFAIGYGAWGGAAFYPFRYMQLYLDPSQQNIHESGCWNPASETLTLTVNGKSVTKTWQEWSRSMVGSGDYADASDGIKLEITSKLEKEFLAKFYRIPLATACGATVLSHQVSYYTEEYNVMYGFGGLELMRYDYTDAKWEKYVQDAGGQLFYK